MSEHSARFPAVTALRVDAFRQTELQLATCEIEPTYSALSEALRGLATAASAKGAFEDARVWWLMSDLCSMMLDVSNHNEPFRPYLVMGNRHSMPRRYFIATDACTIKTTAGQMLRVKHRSVSYVASVETFCSQVTDLWQLE